MFWRVLLLFTFVTSLAYGQDVVAVPAGPDKIQPLKLSEPAPFSGMLYDYDTALRWGNWLKQYQLRLKLDVEAEKSKCSVKLDAAEETLKLHVDTHLKLQKDLEKRVLRLEQRNIVLQQELRDGPAWYESFSFGAIVGVVGAAAVIVASTWALNRASE